MKTTELMIGNWVFVPKFVDETEGDKGYRQIKELRTADLDVYSFKELTYNKIDPIPLTPEILEKNGFVNVYRGRYRFDDNKGSIVEISTINGIIKWVRVSKYDSDDIEDTLAHFTSYEIKHLHELQNALTLCKIYKQIEL